jgi:hypothetical protein
MRRKTTLGLVVTSLALAVPATGFAAIAAVQDDQLPVVPLTQIETRTQLVASTGARVARVDLLWSDVAPTRPANPTDPNDPAYRFERYDRIMAALLTRNVRPIVSVYSSPVWSAGRAAPKGNGFNSYFPKAADYGAFMQAVATRYNGRSAAPTYAARPILVRHYEIWNECNLRRSCLPQFDAVKKPVSPQLYAGLVRAAYPAIKRGNPQAIVIAGATGPKSSTDKTGLSTVDWLAALRKSRVKFDAYSQHIYPAAAPLLNVKAIPSWSSVPFLLKEINKIRRGMPMYITEAGYTTAATPFRKVKVSPAVQAKYLKQVFGLKSVRSSRVPVIVWFNMTDNKNWPGGLFRGNGTKKPSFAAFRSISKRGTLPAALRP